MNNHFPEYNTEAERQAYLAGLQDAMFTAEQLLCEALGREWPEGATTIAQMIEELAEYRRAAGS